MDRLHSPLTTVPGALPDLPWPLPARRSSAGLAPSTELVMLSQALSARAQAEAIRSVRSELLRRVFRQHPARRTLAVLSPEPGDGKTYLAANLAVALAQTGARTLLVDANLRQPRLHSLFGLPPTDEGTDGLCQALQGLPGRGLPRPAPGVPGLLLLSAGGGSSHPLELIEGAAFGPLMAQWPEQFDQVIVDTPAVSCGADALALSALCSARVLVLRRHQSRLPALRQLADALARHPAGLDGVIVNEH